MRALQLGLKPVVAEEDVLRLPRNIASSSEEYRFEYNGRPYLFCDSLDRVVGYAWITTIPSLAIGHGAGATRSSDRNVVMITESYAATYRAVSRRDECVVLTVADIWSSLGDGTMPN